jgi:hypothetical protein
LSKRKTGALRKEQNRQMQNYQKNHFSIKESNTIDFNQEYKRKIYPITNRQRLRHRSCIRSRWHRQDILGDASRDQVPKTRRLR